MKFPFIPVLLFIAACGNPGVPSDPLPLSANCIAVDTVNRVVAELGHSVSGKKVVLYTNGTWSYAPEETPRVKKNRLKKRAPKRATESEVGAFYQAPVTPVIHSETGSSFSGICGAPTRKGGACRRRVKGGGHCWQHGG